MRYYPTAIEIVTNEDINKEVLVKEIAKHNPKVIVTAYERLTQEQPEEEDR